ncbi:TIGR04222 domain-containing membrane protein [Streptomyces sp. RKAG293]|uniref:TIGR04222 domain-containing membrane protein n=1 Tax=Streptomyces sp. RKAG293 TaxID=2893403 RepID=UPI002033C58F|nr:TIGR04222 domain-containing membrane protein [Streptomyces sp. RKAG293]MCM2423967.1 TIGR04222 domain-containing membrane protein [Streptomyces sp. RKAG293]
MREAQARIARRLAELEAALPVAPDADLALNPAELGYLADGSVGAMRASLAWLCQSGAIAEYPDLSAATALPAGSWPLAQAIHVAASDTLSLRRLNPSYRVYYQPDTDTPRIDTSATELAANLQRQNLLHKGHGHPQERWSRWPAIVAWGAAPVAGTELLLDGFWSAALIVAAAVIMLYSTYGLVRAPLDPDGTTQVGMSLLRQARERHSALRPEHRPHYRSFTPDLLATAVALFGYEVLKSQHPNLYELVTTEPFIGLEDYGPYDSGT